MSPEFYEQVYSLLVELGGAYADDRASFVGYFTEEGRNDREWRFQGHLGFGGKFWRREHGHDVNYYPDDQTSERERVRDELNRQIAELERHFKPTVAP